MPLVYAFDHRHRRPPRDLKDRLGGKGANLAEMTSVLGLPVPPGFTITTDACRMHTGGGWPDGLDDEIDRHVTRLARRMGRVLGAADDPLLVSVRSGARSSMPGMMDTVLNLGLNDRSVKGLTRQTGDERFALDSYRRFIAMYGKVVLGIDGEEFESLLADARRRARVRIDARLGADALARLVADSKRLVKERTGRPFPQHPARQLRGAVEAVFRSWDSPRAVAYRTREGIPHDLGTAVNVQAMVFGNRDDTSGTGVAFTRNPATGERVHYGDFLRNAQGEDVVAGIRATEPLAALTEHFPAVADELAEILERLERHYRDMCDTEFTIEQGRLWMLQTRIGKRTAIAALRMAVDMVAETDGIALTRAEAISRIRPGDLDQVLHDQLDGTDLEVIATGLGASPGAAVGEAVFDADRAVAAADEGRSVILVRAETSTDDVAGMAASVGILTSRGGLVSHAAVVARGWGTPAVCGAADVVVDARRRRCTVGDHVIVEGDVIAIDGGTGEVVVGDASLRAGDPPPELDTILGWADEIRGQRFGVRANADNGADAARARAFGAEGIGLCRTEHMFLGDDRLPVVQRMILADGPDDEAAALAELGRVQRRDFVALLEAMDGLPVIVRLLDPPLHEFLPDRLDLEIEARTKSRMSRDRRALLDAVRRWHEDNPMLGVRGVRLGVLKPGLYAMQTRALVEAALERVDAGGHPIVEIMVPLTVDVREMAAARSWVTDAIDEVLDGVPTQRRRRIDIAVGTMIETPRAALLAGEIATAADFFSFGTNDLTQMTFGFSRDDVAARMMPAYLDAGLLDADPFTTVDRRGVGALMEAAMRAGRATKVDLVAGACGEHGGDPASIAFFFEAGLDYVSCSPFRVPVARLAVAQAVLAGSES